MLENWIGHLLKARIASLVLVAIITALAFLQLEKLRIDNANETFFPSGDVFKQRLDSFKATFGNDDFVFILIEVEDAFAPATLNRVAELADKLELEVPHLLELTWIGNVESIEGEPGGILISELIGELDLPPEQLRALGQRALDDPAYRDRLVSGDARSLGLLLEFENYPELDIDPRKDSPPVIKAILGEFSDLNIYVVGGPILDYEMDQQTAVEAPRWAGGALLGMCLLLIITTRSLMGVLVPAITVVLSVIWTMGLVATIGFSLNLFVIMVPTLLLCVGIGDTMHVVAELRQNLREGKARTQALTHTLRLVGKPLLLTTVTTAAGFLAFLATGLQPLRELGIQASLGVVIAFLLTFLVAVPVLSFGRSGRKMNHDQPVKPDIFDLVLKAITEWGIGHRARVFQGFALAALLALMGLSQFKIETNTIQDLPTDHPLRVSFEYVDEHMGGSLSTELVIDTGRADGIKDIELLRKVERLQRFLDEHPFVTQTSSLLDQLKMMHRAVHANDPDAYALPETSSQVAEYLLLYETGGGSQLEKFASFTYDQLRVQARTKAGTFGQGRALREDVAAFVAEEFGADLEIYATGASPMFQHIADLITWGQAKSFTLALTAVTAVMILTLASVRLGLIAMVPNLTPVLFALGAMGWAGAEMNMIAIVLAPMIIGVAVDDTVHFFVRYRHYYGIFGDYDAAYRETMRTVGRPLLFTSLVLIVGFSGFFLSIFAGPRNFAWASMLAFASALAAEFLLAPALLSWLEPLSKRPAGAAATHPVS